MKFGQVEDPSIIDFTLPKDHNRTQEILKNVLILMEEQLNKFKLTKLMLHLLMFQN